MRRITICLFLLAALILPPSTTAWTKPKTMAEVASWLAMRPVYAKCLNRWEAARDFTIVFQDAAAYVEYGTDFMVVAPPICEWFAALARGELYDYGVSDVQAAWSVLVLTHESGHLRDWNKATLNSMDEASTERWAMRHVYAVFSRLGLTHDRSIALLSIVAEIHRSMPDEYRAGDCRWPRVENDRLVGCGPPV